MLNTKVKFAAIALLILANVVLFVWFRGRRAARLPGEYVPLAEITPEEREKRVASFFALNSFRIEPFAAEDGFVTIPRPTTWREQMIHSTRYINPESVDKGSSKGADSKKDNDSGLPLRAGPRNVDIISINVSLCETVPMPEPFPAVMKELVVSRDAYMNKDGILVPVLELLSLNVYYLEKKENTLRETQMAVRLNGQGQDVLISDIPKWLVPNRKLAIGETWVQVGAHPTWVPKTAPRPEVVRKLNRVVKFEGRRAAEISTTSTFYTFGLGPKAPPVKLEEEGITYLDLETGEPLWYEGKSKDNREFTSLTRGCNQIFSKHLIRTAPK